jgi:hypothetical protein
MYRMLLAVLIFFSLALSVTAEEIVLKDGTKIVGRMTAISGDKIEVETAYGKMSVKRGDIVTISFPENGKQSALEGARPSPEDKPKIEEALDAGQYTNKTGDFSLAVSSDWKINPTLYGTSGVIAGLSTRDSMRYLVVVREEYPGSIESYKGLTEIQARSNLGDYEKISEIPMTIDNKSAIVISYRGTLAKANNLPVQFLSAIIPAGNAYYRVTTWCVEPLFNESQPMFEKIISSYHNTLTSTPQLAPPSPPRSAPPSKF